MKLFQIHLWREWHQHRRALGMLGVGLALVIGILSLTTPKAGLPFPDSVVWSALFGMLVVAVSVGGDLFASERQQGTKAFLQRLPGGLAQAFWAKLAFLLAMLVAAALWGAGLGVLAVLQRHGGLPAMTSDAWLMGQLRSGGVWLGVGLCWAFAVSAWVKSGALTLPSTGLFLASMLAPVWIIGRRVPGLAFSDLQLIGLLLWSALGAASCAYVAFALPRRNARLRRRPQLLSVLLAVGFFLPTWAWAGDQYLDLKQHEFYLAGVFVGEGQHVAFLNIVQRPLELWGVESVRGSTAAVLDLATGDLSRVGDAQHSCWTKPRSTMHIGNTLAEAGFAVMVLRGRSSLEEWRSLQAGDGVPYDGRTGEPLEGTVEARLQEHWSQLDWPEAFRRDAESKWVRPSGTGFVRLPWMGSEGPAQSWDPSRDLVLDRSAPGAGLSREEFPCLIVLPGRWLGQRSQSEVWELVDPLTGAAEPVDCLESSSYPRYVFEDGSLLVAQGGELRRVWPESGRTLTLEWIGLEGEQPVANRLMGLGGVLSSTSKSVLSLGQGGKPEQNAVVMLDPQAGTMELLVRGSRRPFDWVGLAAAGEGFGLIQKGQSRLYLWNGESARLKLVLDLHRIELGLEP